MLGVGPLIVGRNLTQGFFYVEMNVLFYNTNNQTAFYTAIHVFLPRIKR
jgi:hypothetical protein